MITVNASDFKNNFGYYLDIALVDGEVYIARHGHVVAKLMAYKDKQGHNKQKRLAKGSKTTL